MKVSHRYDSVEFDASHYLLVECQGLVLLHSLLNMLQTSENILGIRCAITVFVCVHIIYYALFIYTTYATIKFQ